MLLNVQVATSALLLSINLTGVGAATPPYTRPDCSKKPLSSNGICDTTKSPAKRAAALVAAMTPEEKVGNLVSNATGAPRIGLPRYNWWNEALHGVAGAPGSEFADKPPYDSATSFPMPLLMASSFDDDLIQDIGTVIGTESRAWANGGYGGGVNYWTPNVNPFKDPRWGRGSETPGEDALHVSRYARSMECTRDSKAGSIMCAYNAVNGIPACANSYLQETILRKHWNWTETNNWITSDCGAMQDIWQHHNYTKTNAEGAAVAFKNGMDSSCEYTTTSDVSDAYKQGLLTEKMMDRALHRLFEGLVHTGFFDGAKAQWASLDFDDVNTKAAQALALKSAVSGAVLLKNDGTLPLKIKKQESVAMIGFWANDKSKIQGGYSGPAPFLHTPAYAAKQLGLTYNIAWGPTLQNSSTHDNWTTEAVAAAKKSDYILYFGGLDVTAAGEEKDRTTLDWPSSQLTLLQKLAKVGKPLVVIQLGDQVDDSPLLKNRGVNSILWFNYPGQDGGTAVMDIVTGRKGPAGRLPVTQYPSSYAKAVGMTEMDLRPSKSSPGRTYRWYSKAVIPYGFGMHYTTFKAKFKSSKMEFNIQKLLDGCGATYADTCPLPPIQVSVKNTGRASSDFVSLVFIKSDVGPKPYPLKTLAAYGRSHDIAPSATKDVNLQWTLDSIARREQNGDLVLYPGTYTLLLDEPVQAMVKVTLTGKKATLDKWPQLPKVE
ncbi:glycoside hydrolase superfamily [Fusarium tricinctum]|uniref:xylan 1,4-beta-xylosidase n=1 Tax=Fusarium tricinctum TaxID=61284 RepID=A0A8K0RX22_9HYPO|nr:glycoside hydrolase superfamily [Fusarium tricinctum]